MKGFLEQKQRGYEEDSSLHQSIYALVVHRYVMNQSKIIKPRSEADTMCTTIKVTYI